MHTEEFVEDKILQNDLRQNDNILMVCSWCKKIETGDGIWKESDKSIHNSEMPDTIGFRQISHGICLACYEAISEQHQNYLCNKSV